MPVHHIASPAQLFKKTLLLRQWQARGAELQLQIQGLLRHHSAAVSAISLSGVWLWWGLPSVGEGVHYLQQHRGSVSSCYVSRPKASLQTLKWRNLCGCTGSATRMYCNLRPTRHSVTLVLRKPALLDVRS